MISTYLDAAIDELMSLSPYEMRNLLHHIMSGREFAIKKCQKHPSGYNIVSNNDRVSQVKSYIGYSKEHWSLERKAQEVFVNPYTVELAKNGTNII